MKFFYLLNLQQFAEGAAGGTGGASSGDASQAAAGNTGEGTTTGQDAAAGNQETRPSFEDLIKGDYKDDYNKAVQKVVRQRFAQAKATEDRLNKVTPILETLASKYGCAADDIESLARFVSDDDALYEEAAMEAGLTVDQYKRISRIEAENRRLQQERAVNEQRRQAQEQYAKWLEEEQQVREEFPNFDLQTYIQNEQFQRLLRSGVGLREAYIALDADGILHGAMSYTAQQVAKKTASTIAQRGMRPVEGGMSGQASAKATTDVSKLTNAQIADMVMRIERGELTHL